MNNLQNSTGRSDIARPGHGNNGFPPMRVRTYTARSVGECLIQVKSDLGSEAIILSKRSFKKGAWFGRWGGTSMVEITCGTTIASRPSGLDAMRAPQSLANGRAATVSDDGPSHISKLESQLASLTASFQALVDDNRKKAFVPVPIDPSKGAKLESLLELKAGRVRQKPSSTNKEEQYASLMNQLLDAEVALPLARQLINELDEGLGNAFAFSQMRTLISQRLKIANRIELNGRGKMRLLAFVGTTGVGKTTTITKLAAQYALMERRKVGIITLDTQRIAAAQQLQTYGQLLKIPVTIAHDKAELVVQLLEYENQKMDLVLLDTAGRSPNDMLPLGETAHLFSEMDAVEKYLAIPATLSAREMDNIVAKFHNSVSPDAIVLTKLDEASDSTCFGKLLNIQAKYGLPLAYVTTGQKVPDDIAFPDSHAIAARLLSTAVL